MDEKWLVPTNGPARPEEARGYTVFEVMHWNYVAWSTGAVNAAKERILLSQQRLIEQGTETALAHLNGREAIAAATMRAEEQEAEVGIRRQVRMLPAADARALLTSETEIERRLAIRSGYQQVRHQESGSRLLPASPQVPPPQASVEIDVSDRQIEAEALRGVSRLGSLTASELRAESLEWQSDLRRRLPEYAAEEVIARTDRMLSLVLEARR